ncbi:pseudomurein-binding repeat-containing protein [Methanothermobacter sp. THM-2]|uniref:pseudomurein-binding repeat-containing protein n=1 Tax=Methanothermobacter sp. THM-2 TaxID=2606912 RepID=UPI0013658C00|nr:pseudomurein-binding repeat-containing protein [Methanothermobacter sp. THM-2]QHN07803.1 PKD domain-containing protein [Methanothermobacter sp. THM-2]
MRKFLFFMMAVLCFYLIGNSFALSLSYDEVCDASKMIGNYTASQNRIPSMVVVNGKNITSDNYLYAASSTVLNLNQGKRTGISLPDYNPPTNPSGAATGTLYKSGYLQAAQNIKNFMESNGRSPNYANTAIGQVRYESLIYAYARIINFYNSTGKLPDHITIQQITKKEGTITRPRADYTYKIEGYTTYFMDKSTGSIQSWQWDLGDNTTSTERNPTHTYKAGTYTVTLTVRGYGVTSTRTMMLEVMLATIHVNSTAVTFLGQTLNLTFKMPLNNTAKWISIGAMATGPFNETVFLVEDGVAYKLAELTNPFYQVNRQSQREIVWTATAGLNRLIEICTKLGLDELETINEYLNNFNLTEQEKNFILTNHGRCIDILQVSIEYPGEESVTIANITFPGNRSTRTLLLLYTNGYYIHPPGETGPNIIINDTLTWEASNYDAIITYTIATKKITNQTLQYWLNKEYPPGPLKAAYGLFLAGLETIYLHDTIADQAAAKYNTTWTRTRPAMVSAGDHSPATWISLECNHNMGVKANGTTQNLKAFNYARTSTINPIEYYVMEALFPGSDPTTAPITGIGQKLLNGEPLDILETENYTLITDNQGRYIIIDHKTGMVRDIIYNLMGAYCYYHQQTEWAQELGRTIMSSERLKSLLDGNGTVNLEGLRDSVGKAFMGLIVSMRLALHNPMTFVEIISYGLVGQGLIGVNIAAYATTIAYINSKLNNITGSIKEFIVEHQTYISNDFVEYMLPAVIYVLSKSGGGVILQPVGLCMAIGNGILDFRDHYLPEEYWKYIAYHRTWAHGYELRAYVGEDHCIHYIEIPKDPDGTLRWDEAVYI